MKHKLKVRKSIVPENPQKEYEEDYQLVQSVHSSILYISCIRFEGYMYIIQIYGIYRCILEIERGALIVVPRRN